MAIAMASLPPSSRRWTPGRWRRAHTARGTGRKPDFHSYFRTMSGFRFKFKDLGCTKKRTKCRTKNSFVRNLKTLRVGVQSGVCWEVNVMYRLLGWITLAAFIIALFLLLTGEPFIAMLL